MPYVSHLEHDPSLGWSLVAWWAPRPMDALWYPGIVTRVETTSFAKWEFQSRHRRFRRRSRAARVADPAEGARRAPDRLAPLTNNVRPLVHSASWGVAAAMLRPVPGVVRSRWPAGRRRRVDHELRGIAQARRLQTITEYDPEDFVEGLARTSCLVLPSAPRTIVLSVFDRPLAAVKRSVDELVGVTSAAAFALVQCQLIETTVGLTS